MSCRRSAAQFGCASRDILDSTASTMENNHVSFERVQEIFRNDDVIFTQEELDHIHQCGACFNQWAELIKNAEPEQDE
jgi:hypothetical protein